MTHEIKLNLSTDSTGGALVPQAGRFVATASRTRFAGEAVIIQANLNVELVNGLPVSPIILRDLPEGVCWHIRLYKPDGVFILERYVVFPAGIADGAPVNFDSLIDVDPATADPSGAPAPWRVVISGLTQRVKALEEAPHTGMVGFVDVVTGNEPRPPYPFVIWKGGTARPDHMYDIDMWFAPKVTQDETPPNIPTALTASDIDADGFVLEWTGAPDATGFEVTVDGVTRASVATTGAVIVGLPAALSWSVRVRARDNVGNWSALSEPLVVNAPAGEAPALSIFGSAAPSSSLVIGDDGAGNLSVGNRFYATKAIRVVGARFYNPAGADAAFLTSPLTFTAWLGDWPGTEVGPEYPSAAPTQVVTSDVDRVAGTWTELRFPAPITLAPVAAGSGPGDFVAIAARLDGNRYVVAQVPEVEVQSSQSPGVYLAEALFRRCFNSLNGSTMPGVAYNIDLLFEVV